MSAAFDAPVSGALFAVEFVLKSSRLGLDRLSTSTVFVSTSVAAGVIGFLRTQGQALGIAGAGTHLVRVQRTEGEGEGERRRGVVGWVCGALEGRKRGRVRTQLDQVDKVKDSLVAGWGSTATTTVPFLCARCACQPSPPLPDRSPPLPLLATPQVGRIPYFSIQPNLLVDVAQFSALGLGECRAAEAETHRVAEGGGWMSAAQAEGRPAAG